jgi:hypothetical protein
VKELKDIKLNETLLQHLPQIVKAPDLISDKFLFAVTQQTISIVNKQDGREFIIVKQRAHGEHDCLDGLFITYEANESHVKKMTLHYFEKFFDFRKKLRRATFDEFELTEDFLKMLDSCGEVIPNDKIELIQRIGVLVDHGPSEDSIVKGLKPETANEIIAMQNRFREFEKKARKEAKEVMAKAVEIMEEESEERKNLRKKVEEKLK